MPRQNNAFMHQVVAGCGFAQDLTGELTTLQQTPPIAEFGWNRKLDPQWRIQGATGGHDPLKRWTKLFSHLVHQSLIDNMNSPKKLESVLQQLKRFGLWGTLSPDLLSSLVFCQITTIFLISIIEYGFYVNVSMLSNEVVYLRCLHRKCTKSA